MARIITEEFLNLNISHAERYPRNKNTNSPPKGRTHNHLAQRMLDNAGNTPSSFSETRLKAATHQRIFYIIFLRPLLTWKHAVIVWQCTYARPHLFAWRTKHPEYAKELINLGIACYEHKNVIARQACPHIPGNMGFKTIISANMQPTLQRSTAVE